LDDNYRKKLLDFDKLFERNEKKTEEDDNNMETNIDNKNSINPLTNINNKTSQLNSSTGRNNNNSSIFSIKKTKKINIGDIISKRNLYTLRKQISKYNKGSNDVRVPLDENNLKSYNFRSRYENKQATGDDMDLILNYGINTDKPGIIKYFQQNKTINPQYYENLIIYDEYRMNKLNKILEIMMKNKEKEESKNKFSLLSKLDDKNRNGGLHLKKIENLIKKSGSIINERSSFTEKMKYWRKKGI
jgi:high-affinity Fe2+/Pb2+ permease